MLLVSCHVFGDKNCWGMIKKLLGFWLFLFFSFLLQAQPANTRAFDSIYYETAINITASDPVRARHIADSLLTYSESDRQRLRALMLISSITARQEKRGESIELALQALELAEQEKDFSFMARIYGHLSTQYRFIGIKDLGKSYLQRGLEISDKIEERVQARKYKAMAYQEMADYEMDANKYEQAIEYLNLSILSYEKEEDPSLRLHNIASAQELLGRCYLITGDRDRALVLFQEARDRVRAAGAGKSLVAALIYRDLGHFYLEENNPDSSIVYLRKALEISDSGTNPSLQAAVYETLADYYKDRKQMDSFAVYNTRYRNLLYANRLKDKAIVNEEFNRLQGKNTETPQAASRKNPLLILSGILLFAGGVVYSIVKRKKPKPRRAETDAAPVQIQQENLKTLLEKLEDFENSQEFLQKSYSFAMLSGYLDTNSKYLRLLLKDYRNNKDFNSYINDLRIQYIVDKLTKEPRYRNYKISYLADECGFSSHSNFSLNFKKVTGKSPSEFIENLESAAVEL